MRQAFFKRLIRGACVSCILIAAGPLAAQDAVFIIEGTFLVGDTQDFIFDLSRNVDSTETIQLQTVTPAGGIVFDSVLELFDAGNVSQGFNDDFTGLNSLLSWALLGASGTPLTDPLVAGVNYRLRLNEFNNDQAGSWETRLFAPPDAFTLTNASPSGTGTIDSIRVETNGGAGTAVFNNSTDLTITNTLGLAGFGNATLNHSLNTLTVGGITTVNTGGTLNQTAGTINLNGNANFNGGTLTHVGGTFNVATGKTLTASNNATINFSGNHSLNNGVTFDIQSGSDLSVDTFLDIGSNTTGTLIVDGSGSSLSTGSITSFWGVDGGTANVTIRNQATAPLADIELVRNQIANTNGTWDILSGAVVTAGGIRVAADGPVTGGGTLTVGGANSSLTQNGTATLTLGHATNGTATLNVQAGGTFTTGTGITAVNATGTINLTGGGVFDAKGDVNIVGGTVTSNFNNDFRIATGKTLTLSNNAQYGGSGSYDVDGGTTLNVLTGADINMPNGVDVGNGSDGTLLVDGLGSSLTSGISFSSIMGSGGATGNTTFSNSTLGDFQQDLNIAFGSVANTTGTLDILSGSTVTARTIRLAADGPMNGSGTITVDGLNTFLIQGGAADLTVGHATTGTATVNVQNTGVFLTGTGTTTINATGTVNVNTGGSFFARGPLNVDGGTINRNGGTFGVASGETLTASNNAQLNFTNGSDILSLGSTYDIQSGSDFFTNGLDIAANGTGTLIVDGIGSTVTVDAAPAFWGFNGGTAVVTIRNNAMATIGANTINLARAGDNSTGTINIESGADMTTNDLLLADDGASAIGTTATINVTGAGSTLTQNGTSLLTVGGTGAGSTATINIGSFTNTFTTGTGAVNINANGTVSMTGGTFNANGLTTIRGTVTKTAGTLNLNQDTTVDGGLLQRIGGAVNIAAGKKIRAINNGQVNFSGFYSLNNGSSIEIESGSDLIVGSFLDVGDTTNGNVIVDGSGSSLTAGLGIPSIWGVSGGTADVTIRNAALATLGSLKLADGTTAGSSAVLRIQSGASVTADNIEIADNGPTAGTGTLTVDGPGSILFQNGVATLTVGHATNGAATVNVQNGGTFLTGTGTTTINATGTINTSGTFLIKGALNVDGGTLNHNGGLFSIGAGTTMAATNNATIAFSGGYNLRDGVTFDIQSGSDLSAGTFLDVGGGGNTATLIVDGSGSSLSTSLTSSWGSGGGTANVTIRNMATATLGRIQLVQNQINTSNTNGTWNILSDAVVTAGTIGVAVEGPVTGGGTITVDGTNSSLTQNGASTLTLGHATNGFATLNISNAGTFTTGTGTTTVNATGTINVNTGGTLNVNGPFNLAGGTLTGNGTLFASQVVNNAGNLIPQSTSNDGVNFNDLTITGDYTQSSAGRIEFGVVPGHTAFNDVLVLSGSQISLAGELAFDPLADFSGLAMYGASPLINGIALSTLTGVFDTVTGNVLGDGTGLAITYTSTSVLLTRALLGDLNLDGFVGVDDLNIVLVNWNQNVNAGAWELGDPTGEGFVGVDDLNIVLVNWNNGTPPADGANIPEPGSLALFAGVLGALASRRG